MLLISRRAGVSACRLCLLCALLVRLGWDRHVFSSGSGEHASICSAYAIMDAFLIC